MTKLEIIKRHIFFPLPYYVQTWQREKRSAFSVCYSGKKIHLPVSQWFLGGRLKIYMNLIEICVIHHESNQFNKSVFYLIFSFRFKNFLFFRKKKEKKKWWLNWLNWSFINLIDKKIVDFNLSTFMHLHLSYGCIFFCCCIISLNL